MKQALAKVGGNPNVLVNLISRRVRQLTTTGNNRPLIEPGPGMGAADVAMVEIIEGKMDYEMSTATEEEAQPTPKKRRPRA
jgi:DNA-directed RNA polymerase subunit omega